METVRHFNDECTGSWRLVDWKGEEAGPADPGPKKLTCTKCGAEHPYSPVAFFVAMHENTMGDIAFWATRRGRRMLGKERG